MKKILLIIFLLSLGLTPPIFSQSQKGEVTSFTILEGYNITENNTIYIFEDNRYIVRMILNLPRIPYNQKLLLQSSLDGQIFIECGDEKFEPQKRSFDLTECAGKEVTVELEGYPGNALISKGARVIVGEVTDFRFFRLLVGGLEPEITWTNVKKFILTTDEIYNARQRIKEVEDALSAISKSSIVGLEHVADRIASVEDLLSQADECINEGAPEEAKAIADICMGILMSNLHDDCIEFFNNFAGEVPVNRADVTKHLTDASRECIEARKCSDINSYIEHGEKALNEFSLSSPSMVNAILAFIDQYKNWKTYALIEGAIIAILVVNVSYLMFGRKRRRSTKDIIKQYVDE